MDSIDKGLAAIKAFSMLEEQIRSGLETQTFHPDPERCGLHLLMLDASVPYPNYPWHPLDNHLMKPAILLETSFNKEMWGSVDYSQICRGKARISWRTQMSSREVVKLHPGLLQPGDAKYAGAVYYHGLVIAASGVKSFWDEAISMNLGALAHAFILEEMEAIEADPTIDIIPSMFR